jgi:N-acetylglucosaminyldiphosphoundecaprenol N-acetyl-beta-D-mannosaminyltransferase
MDGEALVRAEFLGAPLDLLTLDETVTRAVDAMRSQVLAQHVAINVAKVVKMRSDPELRRDVIESHIAGVDGMGIVWGARLLGIRVPERVAGIDLMMQLLEVCAAEGFRPYFLGARQDILERAIAVAKQRLPGLQFAGARNGYFRGEEEPAIVEQIRQSSADCLFIGMPTPRKERFLHQHRERLGVPFIMGVGGSFDVLAGVVARAPASMQRLGLEWLHRTLQEPGRMWRRYLETNLAFAGLLASAMISRALRRNSRELASGERP